MTLYHIVQQIDEMSLVNFLKLLDVIAIGCLARLRNRVI